jgi:hypothetical protein
MSYRVTVQPHVGRKIAGWGLSDGVLVEVWINLREVLPTAPTMFLRRASEPFDGMNFEFWMVDPENRFRVHSFAFQAVYGQDEETILIVRGAYMRREGV